MRFRPILLLLALLAPGAGSLEAQATTVILVRHAEKADSSRDPDLSAVGRERSARLAQALERFELSAILVTQYKRTHQTADSTAAVHHLTQTEIAASSDLPAHAAAVAAAVRRSAPDGAVLVVGHSNTLGPIIAALGGPEVPDLCDGEYSTLFVLELPRDSAPRLLRASYGATDPENANVC